MLEDAAEFVKTHRVALTDDYLARIEAVEALPSNQSGADKSGRWRGSRAHLQAWLARVERPPRLP